MDHQHSKSIVQDKSFRRKLASPPHSELRTQHSEPFAANSELKPSNSELHHGDSHGNRGI